MAFNFKAFATAFMDDQARAIQKRIQDAEDMRIRSVRKQSVIKL